MCSSDLHAGARLGMKEFDAPLCGSALDGVDKILGDLFGRGRSGGLPGGLPEAGDTSESEHPKNPHGPFSVPSEERAQVSER